MDCLTLSLFSYGVKALLIARHGEILSGGIHESCKNKVSPDATWWNPG
jgi:hypothetical protein